MAYYKHYSFDQIDKFNMADTRSEIV